MVPRRPVLGSLKLIYLSPTRLLHVSHWIKNARRGTTLIGHWVTPATPSAQFVWNCRRPCQCIDVPLWFVKLFWTVISILCTSISKRKEGLLEYQTEEVTPIGFYCWSWILAIHDHAGNLVAIRMNDLVRYNEVILLCLVDTFDGKYCLLLTYRVLPVTGVPFFSS